jgi:hypothetical protein
VAKTFTIRTSGVEAAGGNLDNERLASILVIAGEEVITGVYRIVFDQYNSDVLLRLACTERVLPGGDAWAEALY